MRSTQQHNVSYMIMEKPQQHNLLAWSSLWLIGIIIITVAAAGEDRG